MICVQILLKIGPILLLIPPMILVSAYQIYNLLKYCILPSCNNRRSLSRAFLVTLPLLISSVILFNFATNVNLPKLVPNQYFLKPILISSGVKKVLTPVIRKGYNRTTRFFCTSIRTTIINRSLLISSIIISCLFLKLIVLD